MNSLFINYISCLINQIFKILPLKEECSNNLISYIKDTKQELIGFNKFTEYCNNDAIIMRLVSILQYFENNINDMDISEVKRNVFKAISLCNTLKNKFK